MKNSLAICDFGDEKCILMSFSGYPTHLESHQAPFTYRSTRQQQIINTKMRKHTREKATWKMKVQKQASQCFNSCSADKNASLFQFQSLKQNESCCLKPLCHIIKGRKVQTHLSNILNKNFTLTLSPQISRSSHIQSGASLKRMQKQKEVGKRRQILHYNIQYLNSCSKTP